MLSHNNKKKFIRLLNKRKMLIPKARLLLLSQKYICMALKVPTLYEDTTAQIKNK